jgi:hypothetical protein
MYQKKLLNPKTKMQTPVNLTTAARSASKDSISCGNMGARASGPSPWLKLTTVAMDITTSFRILLQFCTSIRVSWVTGRRRGQGGTYEGIMRVIGWLRNEDAIGM